jgi:pimeloyl-ACP methyl ester carboxylesterase
LDRFHYQLTGAKDSSKKLVFLHGVMGFAANWRRIAKAFEQDFEVLVYDQRGHGRSFQPAVGYGPEDYSEDLRKILDELGWNEIYLVGHSMGGRVAFHFASTHPDRVTRLVIEDIGPSMDPASTSQIIRILDTVPVPFASKRTAKDWFDTRFLELFASNRQKEGLAAYLYANLIENENGEAVWRFNETGIRESVIQGRAQERWEDIADLPVPTLLVRGELSHDLPRETFDRMLTLNRNIKGVEIKGAGHWVHSDRPEEFIAALRSFF